MGKHYLGVDMGKSTPRARASLRGLKGWEIDILDELASPSFAQPSEALTSFLNKRTYRQRDWQQIIISAFTNTFADRGIRVAVEIERNLYADTYVVGIRDLASREVRTVSITAMEIEEWGGDLSRPLIIDGQPFYFGYGSRPSHGSFWDAGNAQHQGTGAQATGRILDDPHAESQKLLSHAVPSGG